MPKTSFNYFENCICLYKNKKRKKARKKETKTRFFTTNYDPPPDFLNESKEIYKNNFFGNKIGEIRR